MAEIENIEEKETIQIEEQQWKEIGEEESDKHSELERVRRDNPHKTTHNLSDQQSEDDEGEQEKDKKVKLSQQISNQISTLLEDISDESKKLINLKSQEISNQILSLLEDDDCKGSTEFQDLLEKYLEPEEYEGIGIQFERQEIDDSQRSEFKIDRVFENSFASMIGAKKGDVLVLENAMNIIELAQKLRSGDLSNLNKINRNGKDFLCKEDFESIDLSQYKLTTKIEGGKGNLSEQIKDLDVTDKLNKIKETAEKKEKKEIILDNLKNYIENKTGKDAQSLEENIKEWVKTNLKDPNVESYYKEKSEEKLFLEIDTVAYLTKFMMSLSEHQLDFRDLTCEDSCNIFKQSGKDNKTSLKIISSISDRNKRVMIAVDGAYYSAFCEEKVGNEWELKYWDAKGVCNPESRSCILDDNYKKKLTPNKRLLNTRNKTDFIVHDGTCGVGAAALCHKFFSGGNVPDLKQTNHIKYTQDFVIGKYSAHQIPKPDPQQAHAQALCSRSVQENTQ